MHFPQRPQYGGIEAVKNVQAALELVQVATTKLTHPVDRGQRGVEPHKHRGHENLDGPGDVVDDTTATAAIVVPASMMPTAAMPNETGTIAWSAARSRL